MVSKMLLNFVMLSDKGKREVWKMMAYLLDMDCNAKKITGFLDAWYALKISKYISRKSEVI